MKKRNIMFSNLMRFALLILCTLINVPMWGQVREVKNAPSPEVANLGTFGSIPVGHYTGTPEITVPLYTMKVGKLSLPIQASYHLANVKPHTPPTSLGIGWALSAGGYIARRVNGVQDEKETSIASINNKAGFYFNHDKLKMIKQSSNVEQKFQQLSHLSGDDWYELAADEFSFCFNGYSGTFFMDEDGLWKVVSDDNIIVEFDEINGFITPELLSNRFPHISVSKFSKNKRFFDKFTLITPDGTRYEFGGKNATEYSVPYYNQDPYYGDIVATCWRLSRITTIEKHVINFEYSADSYMCDIHYSPQCVVVSYYDEPKMMQQNYSKTGYTGFLTMPSRLMKISSETESISFNYERDEDYGKRFDANTQCLYWMKKGGYDDDYVRYMYGGYDDNFFNWPDRFYYYMNIPRYRKEQEKEIREAIAEKITQDYLSVIEIKGSDNESLKIHFAFDTIRNRKLLSCVSFVTCGSFYREELSNSEIDNTIYPVDTISYLKPSTRISGNSIIQDTPISIEKQYEYKFDYYLDSNQDNMWPERNPLIYTDSWGYFSRSGSNPHNEGEWQLGKKYSFSDYGVRESSEDNTKLFTLKSICYPTGGKTMFFYEPHQFSKRFDVQTYSVKDSVGAVGGLRVKMLMNFDASDSLLFWKKYVYRNIDNTSSGVLRGNPCYYDRIYLSEDKGYYLDFYSFEDICMYPLNFNTPPVGYSNVFEYLYDGNDCLLSRTRYKYTNYDTDILNKSHMDLPADYTVNVYDNYASAFFTSLAFERGKLVLKEVMDANGVVLEKNSYDYVRTEGEPCSTISHSWHYSIASMDIFYFSYLYKTYANKYLMSVNKRQEKMNNGMYNTETRYEYADFGLPTRKTLINNLGEKHITDYWYSNESYRATSYVPHPWMKDKNIILPVEIIETLPNNNFYHIENVYDSTSIGVPYISQKKTRCISQDSYYGQNTHVNYTVEKADKFGNPIIWDENGVKTIMIWSNMGQNLVATIQNASYDEVKNALGIAPEKLSESKNPPSTLGSLRTKLSSALIYIYEYDKRMNLVRKTDPNGLVHRYLYDPLNRLTAEFRVVNGRNELVHSYKYNYFTNQ